MLLDAPLVPLPWRRIWLFDKLKLPLLSPSRRINYAHGIISRPTCFIPKFLIHLQHSTYTRRADHRTYPTPLGFRTTSLNDRLAPGHRVEVGLVTTSGPLPSGSWRPLEKLQTRRLLIKALWHRGSEYYRAVLKRMLLTVSLCSFCTGRELQRPLLAAHSGNKTIWTSTAAHAAYFVSLRLAIALMLINTTTVIWLFTPT